MENNKISKSTIIDRLIMLNTNFSDDVMISKKDYIKVYKNSLKKHGLSHSKFYINNINISKSNDNSNIKSSKMSENKEYMTHRKKSIDIISECISIKSSSINSEAVNYIIINKGEFLINKKNANKNQFYKEIKESLISKTLSYKNKKFKFLKKLNTIKYKENEENNKNDEEIYVNNHRDNEYYYTKEKENIYISKYQKTAVNKEDNYSNSQMKSDFNMTSKSSDCNLLEININLSSLPNDISFIDNFQQEKYLFKLLSIPQNTTTNNIRVFCFIIKALLLISIGIISLYILYKLDLIDLDIMSQADYIISFITSQYILDLNEKFICILFFVASLSVVLIYINKQHKYDLSNRNENNKLSLFLLKKLNKRAKADLQSVIKILTNSTRKISSNDCIDHNKNLLELNENYNYSYKDSVNKDNKDIYVKFQCFYKFSESRLVSEIKENELKALIYFNSVYSKSHNISSSFAKEINLSLLNKILIDEDFLLFDEHYYQKVLRKIIKSNNCFEIKD